MMSEDEIARYAAFIRNAKRRLPVGTRVKMTSEAVAKFPRYKDTLGTIVGHIDHGTGASPKVLWDGRKTAASYAPWFIRRVRVQP